MQPWKRHAHVMKLSLFKLCPPVHLFACRTSSNLSNTALLINDEQEAIAVGKREEREWACRHEARELMQTLLQTPIPLAVSPGHTHPELKNWRTFFKDRYINTPSACAVPDDPVGMRVLSNIFTFPLSLAFGLCKIFPFTCPKTHIQVLVVGARDESSLPVAWWKNLLYALPPSTHVTLEMLGPDIATKWDAHTLVGCDDALLGHSAGAGGGADGADTQELGRGPSTLRLRAPAGNKTVLADHPEVREKLLQADLFVLFNPGLGASDVMKRSWTRSLQLLLHTRKPVLCTAHSAGDLDRDLAFVDSLVAEDAQDLGEPLEVIQQPQANPFSSLSKSFDQNEQEGRQVISFNSFIYSFRLK